MTINPNHDKPLHKKSTRVQIRLLKIDKRRMELLPLEEVLYELTSRESKVAMREIELNISQLNTWVDGKGNEDNKI